MCLSALPVRQVGATLDAHLVSDNCVVIRNKMLMYFYRSQKTDKGNVEYLKLVEHLNIIEQIAKSR